jgi:hypothetical protein
MFNLSKLYRLVFICFYFCFDLTAQLSFYKQYSGMGYDYGNGVCQTSDRGYLVTGSSTSFGEGPSQLFLLKLDSLGKYQWSKHYGGIESDIGVRVKTIPEFGHFVAGYTNSYGTGAYDILLLKTNSLGDQEWVKTYGTPSWDRLFDMALTKDSGVVVVGETLHTVDGSSDIYIICTDKDGNLRWTKQIENHGSDGARFIKSDGDSTFIIGGQKYIADSLMYKGWVARMDLKGNVLWEKLLGKEGNCVLKDAAIDSNGEIAVVGMVVRLEGDTLIFEGKGSANGDFGIENQAKIDGVVFYEGVVPFGGGDRYLTVQSFDNQYSYGGFDLAISQNYSGLSWEKGIGQVNYLHDELMGEVITTSDRGAILVGSVTDSWMGGSNVFVFKFYFGQQFTNSNSDKTTFPIASVTMLNTNDFLLYPNPCKDKFYFHASTESVASIQIYSLSGVLISRYSDLSSDFFDVSQLEQGTYYIRLFDKTSDLVGESVFLKW